MSEFNLTRIDRLRYRPTKAAEEFLGDLRQTVMPGDKATVARLAIARSLQQQAPRDGARLSDDVEYGNAIEGTHLFGDDEDIWACIVAASVDVPVSDAITFRSIVEFHWHRGAMLLKDDYHDVKQSDVDFVVRLAGMAPKVGSGNWSMPNSFPQTDGPITVSFGEVSKDFQTDEPVSFLLNGPGISPHMAIMGGTRSGKSRTGLEMASSIAAQAQLPLILIDPKGEFVKNGELIAKAEWGNQTLERYFPGIKPLDVPLSPIPLDFLWRPPTVTENDFAQLAIGFKDSFQKCIKARGDVALDHLRETVRDLLRTQRTPISLHDVLSRFLQRTEDAGRAAGSIGAKLGEINSLNMIQPDSSPPEFFSKRWVISFGSSTEEPKKLAIFLLMDALNSFLMSLSDTPLDAAGNRPLRHLLIVDEAKEILSYKHGALSSLIRKAASRGGVTMLLSQGPDDFDQEEDDFLEQMGTVGAFRLSSTSVKNLAGAFGKKKVEDFQIAVFPLALPTLNYRIRHRRKLWHGNRV